MSDTALSTEPVTVTVAELEQTMDVLTRYSKIVQGEDVAWHVTRAAWSVIGDALALAKYGRVPS